MSEDPGSGIKTGAPRPPHVPPPWFVHTPWRAHRALHRLSGCWFLWTTANKRGWGTLRLITTGASPGTSAASSSATSRDGPNLVALAMNGWDKGHPSWWLNLEAHPWAVAWLAGQHPRPVRARAATSSERDRLWHRWAAVNPQLDSFARLRSTQTPVVVLEPRDGIA